MRKGKPTYEHSPKSRAGLTRVYFFAHGNEALAVRASSASDGLRKVRLPRRTGSEERLQMSIDRAFRNGERD